MYYKKTYFKQDHIPAKINCKVLVLHGYKDTLAPPTSLAEFHEEMNKSQADAQVHVFGTAYHAFTDEGANNPENG